MEITYKITNQELKEILSKELGVPVLEVITETDGSIITKTAQEKKVHVGNTSEMDTIREDFTKKFGQEKTDRILCFFDEFSDGLKETTRPDYPDRIFFYKEGNGKNKVWMEQDSKNGYLWCTWAEFWSFFNYEIGINYSETQYVVKTMVEQYTERKVGTPLLALPDNMFRVEQYTERKVGTPGSVLCPNEKPWWNSILNER